MHRNEMSIDQKNSFNYHNNYLQYLFLQKVMQSGKNKITYLQEPLLIKQMNLQFHSEIVNYSHAFSGNILVKQAQFLIFVHTFAGCKQEIFKIGVKDQQGKCISWIMGQTYNQSPRSFNNIIAMPVNSKKELLITLDKPQSKCGTITIYLVSFTQKSILYSIEPLIVLNTTKLSASSIYNNNHDVSHSYLNYVSKDPLGWSAKQNNVPYQFIQADFGKQYLVSKIALQGCGSADQWVTRFAVYIKKFNHLQFIKIGQFEGCCDRNTIVQKQFQPIITRFIKLIPLQFQAHISMRWEVYGTAINEQQ